MREIGEHRMRGQYVYLQTDKDVVRQLLCKDMVHEIEQWELHPDFFEAARKGLMDSLKFHIIRKKIDVNMLDFGGNTALHIACMLRRENVIRYLLDNGADPSIRDSMNRKPLDIIRDPALRRDMERFAWECTPEGRIHVKNTTVPPDTSLEASHIWSAAFRGDVRKLKQFIAQDPNSVNATDNRGNTPTICAAMSEQNEVLKQLFSIGVNMDATNRDGMTAYSFARGPAKKDRMLKLQKQNSAVGKVEEMKKIYLVKLGRKKRTFKKMRVIREISIEREAWEQEKRNIRKAMEFERAHACAEYVTEVGTANTVNKVLFEAEQFRLYLERLRLEDEERERQRQLEIQKQASIEAMRKKREAEELARRLKEEEEERLALEKATAESLARKKARDARIAAERAAAQAEAERKRQEALEHARRLERAIAKEHADRPIKTMLFDRLRKSGGKLK